MKFKKNFVAILIVFLTTSLLSIDKTSLNSQRNVIVPSGELQDVYDLCLGLI